MKSRRHMLSASIVILVIAAVPNAAAQQWPPDISLDWPDDATYWSLGELQGLAAELGPQARASGRHVAAKPLLIARTHAVFAIHRDATGEVEQHLGVSDYCIITSGQGTLVLGGEIQDRREVAPGEHRGSSIAGGRSIPVEPGDQVDIPPNEPHQILVEEGKSITYLIIKVNIGLFPWGFMR